MPHQRSQEAEWWYEAVYEAVQQVPVGKVTSYGHIAKLLGEPQRSRQVGICLKHLPPSAFPSTNPSSSASSTSTSPSSQPLPFHANNVPWQRIINARGQISPRGPGSVQRQAAALRRERVQVTRNAMGEHAVDFAVYGWFPAELEGEGQEVEGWDADGDADGDGTGGTGGVGDGEGDRDGDGTEGGRAEDEGDDAQGALFVAEAGEVVTSGEESGRTRTRTRRRGESAGWTGGDAEGSSGRRRSSRR